MPLQHIAFLIPEFSIEQLTQVRELACVASTDVCLEVERVTSKVTGVVHVEEHFFLWYVPAKEFKMLLPALQRRRKSRVRLCALKNI